MTLLCLKTLSPTQKRYNPHNAEEGERKKVYQKIPGTIARGSGFDLETPFDRSRIRGGWELLEDTYDPVIPLIESGLEDELQ